MYRTELHRASTLGAIVPHGTARPELGHAHRNLLIHAEQTRGTNWRKDETLKLLDAWGQENVQGQLEGCKKNQAVYEKISTELQEAGYERTYQQCRDKIKN